MSETKKRFIAGATCPACAATDTLQMWRQDGLAHRKCVACGYADTLDAQAPATVDGLAEAHAQPLRIGPAPVMEDPATSP
jgi:uncharacterized metal-binding protein (TIGR02443 family)